MDVAAKRVVYRPRVELLVLGLLAIPSSYLCLRQVGDNPAWLLSIPVGAFFLSELWRRATLTDERLVVRGRISSRAIDLSDVTQVGLSSFGTPWVQPREGPAFKVRMTNANSTPQRGPRPFLLELRSRSEAVGADIGAELPIPTAPAGPTTKVFSW